MSRIPLNAAASNGDTNRQATTSLPPEVVQCLENARFLHLATCTNNIPTVSLMNYTYLPPATSPYSAGPLIIMTTNPASKKMANLLSNPHVSLLVHDWVSHRPPTTTTTAAAATAATAAASPPPPRPPPRPPRSALASLLLNLNTSAMSSISATINGRARLVAPGSPEERWFRQAHLENNTFDESGSSVSSVSSVSSSSSSSSSAAAPAAPAALPPPPPAAEDGGRGCFVAGEEVRVIAVDVRDVRISDWKGNVKDWFLVAPGEAGTQVVNGA